MNGGKLISIILICAAMLDYYSLCIHILFLICSFIEKKLLTRNITLSIDFILKVSIKYLYK